MKKYAAINTFSGMSMKTIYAKTRSDAIAKVRVIFGSTNGLSIVCID